MRQTDAPAHPTARSQQSSTGFGSESLPLSMGAATHYWLSLACSIALLGIGSNAFISSRADIGSELGAQLSEAASIYFPDAEEFTQATDRWSDYRRPNFTVVVQVAEEEDVAKTVSRCQWVLG
ncbi:hypothetical protein BJY00DRAFT_172491 [Aspergillus carlsbadensis]|nr:hypothetical protein BJY00DRAFT_172491 [Aspergillus carlsbadensis]